MTENQNASSASQAMQGLRTQVISAWSSAARSSLNKAGRLPDPILLNTLPAFYDSLAQLLTCESGVDDVSVIAQEHGGERARLSGYDTTALIEEFQLFRRVLFDQLHQAAITLTHEQRQAIDSAIDSAIRESVTAFAMVQSALREQFIAAITHDIRTPLSNASMAAQIIESRAGNEALRTMARKILDNTARIDVMTRDLLDCIVFNSGERLPLDITEFDMAELAREIVPAGVSFEAESVTGHWCRESMRRALENLLGNAMKYGEGNPAELTVRREGERVRIAVHNDGNPIPASQLESIFQIYRRAQAAKGHRDGWGVGLPYARRVAESHGGSIIVTSSVESGTTFVIDVPIDARPFEDAPTVA
ncbi:MAG TPA: HAMP domain-containing sensor histidine kinase [Pseudoduganella sp.]